MKILSFYELKIPQEGWDIIAVQEDDFFSTCQSLNKNEVIVICNTPNVVALRSPIGFESSICDLIKRNIVFSVDSIKRYEFSFYWDFYKLGHDCKNINGYWIAGKVQYILEMCEWIQTNCNEFHLLHPLYLAAYTDAHIPQVFLDGAFIFFHSDYGNANVNEPNVNEPNAKRLANAKRVGNNVLLPNGEIRMPFFIGLMEFADDCQYSSDSQIQDTQIQDTQIQDIQVQNSQIQDIQIQDTQIQDIQMQDTQEIKQNLPIQDLKGDLPIQDSQVQNLQVKNSQVQNKKEDSNHIYLFLFLFLFFIVCLVMIYSKKKFFQV